MNSLHRLITKDEIVVLKKNLFKPEFQELKYRLFLVRGGFGMRPESMGSAIYGTFISDGEECRYEGHDIDAEETDFYQRGLL
jgi:hypothetical protein